MRDIFTELATQSVTDPDPVRRAQIQMKQPLPKRFYKTVDVQPSGDAFQIFLDGKPVRTPAKNVLELPSLAAAELVADEWRAQEQEIDPARMPVTRLANTALDGVVNAMDAVFSEMTAFAGTDLLCYRADFPEGLVSAQAKSWDPILYWAARDLGARFILIEGIIHREQPGEALSAIADALRKFDSPFHLAALHTITTLTGSALLAAAFAHKKLSADDAWRAAHVDEDWNIAQWGADEEAERRRNWRWREMKAAADLFEAL